jgi:hypothetical protein
VKVGTVAEMDIATARDKARVVIQRIEDGKTAFEPPTPAADSVAVVAQAWLKRHVEKRGLRTATELERIVTKYITPHVGDRPFREIRRGNIAALLDVIEDKHGPGMADKVLSTMRSISVWFQTRNDDYEPPFVKNMKRGKGDRDRILDDDEVRKVWKAAGESGAYGDLLKLCLLTAQRHGKIKTLLHGDIDADGVWTVATEEREKHNMGKARLPKAALDIIRSQPRRDGDDRVFARSFSLSALKHEFDAKCELTKPWRLHDLRRTARSLMSRAKANPDHAELVMGHMNGVRWIYDRFKYVEEKSIVLNELASELEFIIDPPTGNVRKLREAV